MAIVNFWVVYSDPGRLTQVESYLPDLPLSIAGGARTHLEPPEEAQARSFDDHMGWKLRSLYRRIDDLSDIVSLREDLQWLEDTYPGSFYMAGMWHYETGEPIGGVGSPWFQTPPEVANFMPGGVIEQTVLLAGQATRKFV